MTGNINQILIRAAYSKLHFSLGRTLDLLSFEILEPFTSIILMFQSFDVILKYVLIIESVFYLVGSSLANVGKFANNAILQKRDA